MPSANINPKTLIVKTAAEWAADSVVYNGRQILISSDVLYTGTDQRKWKLSNGTDTWSNLDYMPIGTSATPGLIDVLTADPSTGNIPITSPDGEKNVTVDDSIAKLEFTGGIDNGYSQFAATDGLAQMAAGDDNAEGSIGTNSTKTRVQHDLLLEIDSPSVRFSSSTANRIVTTNGSKDFTTALTATTDGTLAGNSDTNIPSEKAVKTYADTKQAVLGYTAENSANKTNNIAGDSTSVVKYPHFKAVYDFVIGLGYQTASAVNALITTALATFKTANYLDATSSIQGQLNLKTGLEPMWGTITTFSPADNTISYFGMITNQATTAAPSLRQFQGWNDLAYGMWVIVDVTGILGTTENVTFDIYNVTDNVVVSGTTMVIPFDARGRVAKVIFAAPVQLLSTKFYSIQGSYPAYATNPTAVVLLGKLLMR